MYEELVKRLRSAESNYQETLDCLSEAADAIEELMRRCGTDRCVTNPQTKWFKGAKQSSRKSAENARKYW